MCYGIRDSVIIKPFGEFSKARLIAAIEQVSFLVSMQTVHCTAQRVYEHGKSQ